MKKPPLPVTKVKRFMPEKTEEKWLFFLIFNEYIKKKNYK